MKPVQPGVRAELLATPRSDAQLATLLASTARRTYTVYSFELGPRADRMRVRRWEGMLVMPRSSDLGSVTDLKVQLPGAPVIADRWYRHTDGTLSRVLLNRFGESVGVLSANERSQDSRGDTRIREVELVRVAIDLNGDDVVDYLHVLTTDGREIVMVSLSEGAALLEQWHLGENPLCDPRSTRDRPDKRNQTGQPGTFSLCGDKPKERGPLAGVAREVSSPPPDALDRMCAGRGGPGVSLPGGGPRLDAAGGIKPQEARRIALEVAWGVYLSLVAPKIPKPEDAEAERLAEAAAREAVSEPTRGVAEDDDDDDAEDARETPDPEGDPEDALDTVCAMRAQSERRYWMVSLEQAEKQAAGAAEIDCDDPVTDPAAPAAMDDRAAMPKCGPARERGSVTEQIMAMLGAYNDRRCGPYEQPGPDGQCRGGRNLPDGRARLWYGYGDVIGLVPCEGTACDPRDNP